jgi:NitT/TauT family transport system ATP-binding protein
MILIERLSKTFETARGTRHLALSDISLDIAEGEFVSILGPSGCGKSTLLYIVGGFVPPSEGAVRVKGAAVTGPGPDRGPVFQEFALFPWKTVLGNVMYGLIEQGAPKKIAEDRARALLEMVHLKGYENFYPKELSGGMKQRVAIARTLAYGPSILLMDEPFGALDAHTRTGMQHELLEIWERDRKTVLFVTHSVRGGGVSLRPRGGADALARAHQADHRDRPAASAQARRALGGSALSGIRRGDREADG